jgi:hypothetical protein
MPVIVCLLVLVIGLLMYALAVNPKLQVIGLVSFSCGLGALLLRLPATVAQLFG